MTTRRKPVASGEELLIPPQPYPKETDPIPIYRIDLALAPSQRYVELARDLSRELRHTTPVFLELLEWFIPNQYIRSGTINIMKFLLRGVYDDVQTQEIKGIAEASGVELYLLVALNVLLDALLGCTSGAARVGGGVGDGVGEKGSRLLHFRTLDWAMDRLRELLVILEFVDSSSEEPQKIVARTVTYAGFVGVLTGVREGLSISLNFRPSNNSRGFGIRWHQLLVVLGYRPSIASILRDIIFRPRPAHQSAADVAAELASTRTSPAYLCLCDGEQASMIEKDLLSGAVRTDSGFVVQTNHDVSQHESALPKPTEPSATAEALSAMAKKDAPSNESWVEESAERRQCMIDFWRERTDVAIGAGTARERAYVLQTELEKKVRTRPISREWTHFRCVMDPQNGDFTLVERGPPPLPPDQQRELQRAAARR
ncbi:hypothetical protein jhhlp_007043 [Lomentospora prolificans]|uniref:ceramidase n=1 Tax=Lomentospora prolificans TaxID=41688 RepID=A0A2N3N1J2_9PEZI|nr:hypothetical protein jhhlp_007043 [Lomentospora prolificans]